MIRRPELPKDHVLYDIARYILNPQERRPIRMRISRRGYYTVERAYGKRRMPRGQRQALFWWTFGEEINGVTGISPRSGLLARIIRSRGY